MARSGATKPSRSHADELLDGFAFGSPWRRTQDKATAIKRVLIWQLQEAAREQGLSKAALAARMGTSRTQIDRLLDPDNTRVTLHSLQRAASCLGRQLKLELV